MSAVLRAVEVEEIPGPDGVSRHIDRPNMAREDGSLVWENVFCFPGGKGESLVWRKYAPTIDEVHALGCSRQAQKIHDKPTTAWRYTGAVTTLVAQITGQMSSRGHGFVVVHEPSEGIHHAEVKRRIAADKPFEKSDKAELKVLINGLWEELESHTCP